LIAAAFVAAIFYFAFHQLGYQWNWAAVSRYRGISLSGWLLTLLISLAAPRP